MKFMPIELTQVITGTSITSGAVLDIGAAGCDTLSATIFAVVDTPSAKTFDSGVKAAWVVQDLTYTAASIGTAGNSITIAYTAGGTAGSEVVTVVGNAISVQIQSGVSTATQIRDAVLASAPATALVSVSISGTGSNTQTAPVSATNLAGGTASEVDVAADTITIPSHGLPSGLVGRLTTTGTLPAGLALATNYYVIVVDANTIKLANSLANAQAGIAVNITDEGSSGAVNTFTPTAISSCNVRFQGSNFPTTGFKDLGSIFSISANLTIILPLDRPVTRYVRLTMGIASGSCTLTAAIVGKGDK